MNLKDVNVKEVSINDDSVCGLFQYNTGQILKFIEDIEDETEVHFSTEGKEAIRRFITDNQVQIPNDCLELGEDINAYIHIVQADSSTTIKKIRLHVKKREKAEEVVAPEDEPTFREEIQAIMDETKEIAQSVRDDANNGEFDGKDYVLTEEDKEEIASMVPGGGSGTSNYNDLENKPKINGTELKGNVSLEDLGIEIPEIPEIEIPKFPNITKATYNLLTEVLDNKVWSTSGVLTDNVQFLASDYIANDGLEYSIQTKTKVSVFTARICQFDADKKFIKADTVSGNGVSILNFTLDDGCTYFTVSVKKYQGSNVYDLTDMMIVKGHEYIIPYKPHLVIKDECLPSDLFSQICFGAEYLYSWYKKLIDGDSVKVTLLGDSTLSEAYITKEGCKKQDYIKKMLTNKGIDVTILNSAVGGTTTNELIEYSLDENKLPSDTDLIICNYGCNDWTLSGTYAERLANFKSNYETFFANLESRGFNYDNLGVIIMTPSLASNSTERYQFTFDCKKILQELAPKYHFAMFDTYKVDQDHLFTDNWSVYDDDIQAGIHPQYFMNAMLMQYLEWLVIPSGIGTVSGGTDGYSKEEIDAKLAELEEKINQDALYSMVLGGVE